jgi:hypothetical protein
MSGQLPDRYSARIAAEIDLPGVGKVTMDSLDRFYDKSTNRDQAINDRLSDGL